MKRLFGFLLGLSFSMIGLSQARAFCGFYVAKADTKLFNQASQVAIAHNDDKTVMTMENDFQGDMKEFAIVIPVPTFINKDQIHVANKALLDHLDAYSAPRLVEYYDGNPCQLSREKDYAMPMSPAMTGASNSEQARANALGVKIEAQYTVGEYDILILSATQSQGLETWLRESGYRIPEGATDVIGSYLKQNMKFFVAKVNLTEQNKLGYSFLRPLQIAYESPKFMLPIRLGTVNANGPQEIFVYMLTKNGRVETTNYRTVKLPSGMDIPTYVKNEFGDFYKALFNEQVRKEDMRTVFTEYAWDMNWCDPCAAQPLSDAELKELGVFWLGNTAPGPVPLMKPFYTRPARIPLFPSAAKQVFLTRLHLRYDRAHFPEDLVFQETADRENFQGRYVMRHPWTGSDSCEAAKEYHKQLKVRQQREAQSLASLTGWNLGEIQKKMGVPQDPSLSQDTTGDKKWYQKIWN